MTKKVRYNGGILSYFGCTKPTNLIVGKEYEVISENDRGFQTDYTLRGVKGHFTSTWFDEVSEDCNIHMAIAHKTPVIGQPYLLFKLEFDSGMPKFSKRKTSNIRKFENIGNDIYKVFTLNSIYIVKVG